MRCSFVFLTYLAAVALGSLAASADPAPVDDLEAARAALASGDDAAAAASLRAKARALHAKASEPETARRDELLTIAHAFGRIGADVEMGGLHTAALDRRLAVVMHALALHHLARARAALDAGDEVVASEQLATSLDTFASALRWHGLRGTRVATLEHSVDDESPPVEIGGALALAAEVRRALGREVLRLSDY